MPLVKKSQPLPARPVIIMLYADPGTGKTSLFNTVTDGLLIDTDRGADRSWNRQDTLMISNWKEVLEEQTQGTFENYKSIGIDTPKSMLDDYLMVYVAETDYKLKTNKLKAYGAIGDEFKLFINQRRNSGADIVLIAHSKIDKDGDNTKITPDVTGGSLALLLRIADQVGYMYMENGKRTIDFNPTDRSVGKNVAGFPKMIVPDKSDPAYTGFLQREVIDKVKESLSKMTEEQMAAIATIDKFVSDIESTEPSDENFKKLSTELGAIADDVVKLQVRNHLLAYIKKVEWAWYKEEKLFKKIPAKKEAAAPVVAETKPEEVKTEEVKVEEVKPPVVEAAKEEVAPVVVAEEKKEPITSKVSAEIPTIPAQTEVAPTTAEEEEDPNDLFAPQV
jgi:hypothetical protein